LPLKIQSSPAPKVYTKKSKQREEILRRSQSDMEQLGLSQEIDSEEKALASDRNI
jgi:hypothetical protein